MRMLAAVAGATACLLLLASSAAADVGIEKVDRHAGRQGEEVNLTVGCGFCYPPCKGPKGERHPEGFEKGPCMLGTDGAPPPASFGVSLVSRSRAERLLERTIDCSPHPSRCPSTLRPPRGHGYRYLGEALPPAGGNNPEHGDPPRYLLGFEIPRLAPGQYSYVIWCDACADGRAGSLVVNPRSPLWRLAVASFSG
jgi:hypothetical protein